MKLTCAGSKNSPTYYIQKSIRIDGKVTTKTVERLGSIDEIKLRSGDEDPIVWAKNYAKELTLEEKDLNKDILVKYSPTSLIEKDVRNSCNVGYLFLKHIYYSLGIDKICSKISSKYKIDYNLNEILSMLVFERIISPGSKKSSLEDSINLLEKPKCKLHQVYRALEVISNEMGLFQSEIYKNSKSLLDRNKSILYYDCTNFFFEIEQEDDFRKYGHSKENRPNPIVQMGLFMDSDGIPLAFSITPGNVNEQTTLIPLERNIIKDFKKTKFVVCTDAGLSSYENRLFNNFSDRYFITAQSLKKLKGHLKEWALDSKEWLIGNSKKIYDLEDVNESEFKDTIFHKERWINENGLEQKLVVTFSFKYKHFCESKREGQISRALKLVNSGKARVNVKNQNDCRRFIKHESVTKEGEVADKDIYEINREVILKEKAFDGFYAVCTNLDATSDEIARVNKNRWEIEESFRIMKSEFKARPVYLTREDRIKAHFTTCFISLILYRILEKKLKDKYTCEDIIGTIKNMNVLEIKGEGFIPAFTRTDLTDDLHDVFNFRLDNRIIPNKKMRKILKNTEKREK